MLHNSVQCADVVANMVNHELRNDNINILSMFVQLLLEHGKHSLTGIEQPSVPHPKLRTRASLQFPCSTM